MSRSITSALCITLLLTVCAMPAGATTAPPAADPGAATGRLADRSVAGDPTTRRQGELADRHQGGTEATVEIVVLGDPGVTTAHLGAATTLASAATSSDPVEIDELTAIVTEVPESEVAATLAALDSSAGVAHAYVPGRSRALDVTPNDPFWPYQAGFRLAAIPALWSHTTGAPTTRVAIVDSGLSPHPELAGRVAYGYDFVDDDGLPTDDAGHGTKVALVALGAGNDSAGAAGACWSCEVLAVRVLERDPVTGETTGSNADIADGIVYAANAGADVINLSLGSPDPDPLVGAAVNYAQSRDVVVVASAGNSGADPVAATAPQYPAALPGVLSVAGLTAGGALESWSTRGPWVRLATSGCNYVDLTGAPYRFCGTSSATPVAVGVAALLRSAFPTASATRVIAAMTETAVPIAGETATGRLAATAAFDRLALESLQPTPAAAAPPVDSEPPTVTAGAPAGYLAGPVTFSARATDNVAVGSIEALVDGVPIGAVAGGDASFVYDVSGLPDGPHTFTATAVDRAGLTASASAPFTVDHVNPVAAIFGPRNGSTLSRSAVVTVYAADPNGIMGTFLVANGKVVTGWPGAGVRTTTVPLPRRGKVTFVAITVDAAGRISGSNFVTVTVGRRR